SWRNHIGARVQLLRVPQVSRTRTLGGGSGATLVAWSCLLAASGYLLLARGYLLLARGYLLAGCFRAWYRASHDGTRTRSSRPRLCRPASAPGNPGGCLACHHGDPPRRSAHMWLL